MDNTKGFKLSIQPEVLRAVGRFMAKQDIRYYLNGLHVEKYERVAYLVACDGSALAIARIEPADGTMFEGTGSAIIPRELVEKLKPGRHNFAVILEVGETGPDGKAPCSIADLSKGVTTAGETIDGKFPDWRRVIPNKVDGTPAQFNPEYLKRAADAAKDLGSKLGAFALGYNGNGAALVRFNSGHEVLAVIMPWREDSPEAPPAWVDENPLDVGRVLDREEAHAMAIAEEKRRAKHQLIEEPIEEPERLAA